MDSTRVYVPHFPLSWHTAHTYKFLARESQPRARTRAQSLRVGIVDATGRRVTRRGRPVARTWRTRRPAAPCTIWSRRSSARRARKTSCSLAAGSPPLGSESARGESVPYSFAFGFELLVLTFYADWFTILYYVLY